MITFSNSSQNKIVYSILKTDTQHNLQSLWLISNLHLPFQHLNVLSLFPSPRLLTITMFHIQTNNLNKQFCSDKNNQLKITICKLRDNPMASTSWSCKEMLQSMKCYKFCSIQNHIPYHTESMQFYEIFLFQHYITNHV